MELICVSPPRAGHIIWQRQPDEWTLTVFCKVTYELCPGEARLAREQQEPRQDDRHFDDDPARGVFAPTDATPCKPHADVLLVGTAFAPAAKPTRTIVARLAVAGIDKSIEIWGSRALNPDGTIQEGEPFTTMPLRWEHAAGGPDTPNPVGMRLDARDAYDRILLPHLQPPDATIEGGQADVAPIGFGPIAGSWPVRAQRLGRHASEWDDSSWRDRPLPEELDLRYFNAAPLDQQVESLRDDEQLVLDNLHRDHPQLTTKLPGVRPAVFVELAAGPARLDVVPDTLWIDTTTGVCTLTFRGERPVSDRDAPGRIVVAMESGSETLTWPDVERMLPGTPKPSKPRQATVGLPATRKDRGTMLAAAIPDMRMALPFAGGKGPPPAPGERPSHPGIGLPFSTPPPAAAVGPSSVRQPLPAPPPAPAQPLASVPPAPVGPSTSGVDPSSSLVPTPASAASPPEASPSGPGPQSISSPWASGASQAVSSGAPVSVQPGVRALGEYAARAAAAPEAVQAAAPAVPAIEPEAAPSDPMLLLWFDPECLPRVRRQERFRSILEALDHRPVDRDLDDAVPSDDPFELEDRREMFEVLARGKPDSPTGVRRAVESAMRKDGKFVPQLVLLAGDLCTPFDELERLKATLTTVQPLMREEDEDLKAAVEHAREFLGMPDLICPPSVLEGFTKRVHDEFDAEKLSLAESYLEDETDRVLLDNRLYQKRIVYGAPHLRTLLELAGEELPLPAYLPEAIAGELPLFQRFRVHLLAEALLKEDQNEASEVALRALALVRVVRRPSYSL